MERMTVGRQMRQRIQTLPLVSREGMAVYRLVTGLMAEIRIGLSKSLTNLLPVTHEGREVTRAQSAQKRGSIALLPTLRQSRPLLYEGRLGRTLTTFYLILGLIYLQSTPKHEYIDKAVSNSTVGGFKIHMPLAIVWLHVADNSIHLVVAVDEKAKEEALLGRDIGPVLFEFIDDAKKKHLEKKVEVQVEVKANEKETQSEVLKEVNVHVTRAEKKNKLEEKKTDEKDNERDGLPLLTYFLLMKIYLNIVRVRAIHKLDKYRREWRYPYLSCARKVVTGNS